MLTIHFNFVYIVNVIIHLSLEIYKKKYHHPPLKKKEKQEKQDKYVFNFLYKELIFVHFYVYLFIQVVPVAALAANIPF